jgi:hypothetical protein
LRLADEQIGHDDPFPDPKEKLPQGKAARLGIMDKAALLDRIGSATDARDKALRMLGLDKPADTDDFPTWPAFPAIPDATPTPVDHENPTEGTECQPASI